jgi:hypothetical protein
MMEIASSGAFPRVICRKEDLSSMVFGLIHTPNVGLLNR